MFYDFFGIFFGIFGRDLQYIFRTFWGNSLGDFFEELGEIFWGIFSLDFIIFGNFL